MGRKITAHKLNSSVLSPRFATAENKSCPPPLLHYYSAGWCVRGGHLHARHICMACEEMLWDSGDQISFLFFSFFLSFFFFFAQGILKC